ncbi:thioesterase family protein [Actinomycetota bacterium]|nr:thioesterase family protein [Micrococcales bacterium]
MSPISVDDVRMLPGHEPVVIPPEFGDANGHMNVRHYLALHDESGWPYFERLGFGTAYAADRRRGLFALEHHLTYLREVHIGDSVRIHTRLLERGRKTLHVMRYLVNDTRDQVANTLEIMTCHVDLETRRTVAFTDDEMTLVDAQIAADQALPWPAVTCGAMAVRS